MADLVVVTDLGLEHVAAAVLALGATEPKYVEWGIGAGAPARTDTALGTPSAEARGYDSSAVVASVDTGAAADTYRTVGTITSLSDAHAVTEVGTWTNLTLGVLFLRATFSAINLETGNSIEFTIDTKFAPA